jgi:hypothetical protein
MPTDADTPWKEILTNYFPDFMVFFFPHIAAEIDWTRGYEVLDKELRQITRESEIGGRIADHLVKVWKTDGSETWVLIHVEVQGQPQPHFGKRVFVYHYRIHDLHDRPVLSLAVLADDHPNWYVNEYKQELWGCRTVFQFPAVKLLHFQEKWPELEASDNPFAVVVMAHLRTLETRKDPANRFRAKLTLSKSLYRRGWSKQEIIDLYRFIDWIMDLPKELETAYHAELSTFEEEIKMPYVTTAERIGIEKGLAQGKAEGLEEGQWKKALETAKNLMALEVLTDDQIANATGLPLEEVLRLREKSPKEK